MFRKSFFFQIFFFKPEKNVDPHIKNDPPGDEKHDPLLFLALCEINNYVQYYCDFGQSTHHPVSPAESGVLLLKRLYEVVTGNLNTRTVHGLVVDWYSAAMMGDFRNFMFLTNKFIKCY